MLQALSGPTACWAGLLRMPCWAVLRRGRRPAHEPSALRAFGSARRLEARPGPATTHGHRSQALRSLHTGGASVRILYVHSATCPGLVPLRSTPPLA